MISSYKRNHLRRLTDKDTVRFTDEQYVWPWGGYDRKVLAHFAGRRPILFSRLAGWKPSEFGFGFRTNDMKVIIIHPSSVSK
jgi:hypothetical protein